MKRTHVLAVSLMLAVAVVAGGFAAYKTVGLGSSSQAATASPSAAVAAKKAQLDRMERSIQTALAKQPPKLPRLVHRDQASEVGGGGVVYVSSTSAAAPAATSFDDDDHYESEDGDEHEGGEDD